MAGYSQAGVEGIDGEKVTIREMNELLLTS